MKMPTIRIDNEVYSWLQKQARPFEDTPNTVLRRIANLDNAVGMESLKRQASSINASYPHNHKTPQPAFRQPILEILKKHGGQADRMTVLKELEMSLEGQLTEYDKADIKSGTMRWQKTAEWEVRVMREDQILKAVSETPRGVWALTAKGFQAAEGN
jgi:hypothetical protein